MAAKSRDRGNLKARAFRAGDRVRVRSFAEIATTLDAEGALDGLPFLPEMARYCGRAFTVRRRVDKLIQEGVGSSMRRIRDVVLLDGTICDGAAHGDCRRACFPLWKTAWLESGGAPAPAGPAIGPSSGAKTPTLGAAAAGPSADMAPVPPPPASLSSSPNGCQVTALMTATTPLPLWHPSRHLLELKAGTYSVREYAAYLFGGLYRKTVKRLVDTVARRGSTPLVVAEGVKNAEGKFLADAGTRDAFGHAQLGGVGPVVAQLVKDKLGYKYHWAVADYLQRAARHIASKVDVEQAYAVGKAAVELALKGHHAVMPAIVRISDKPYRWKIGVAPLEKVANVEKMLPRDYITPDGFHITAKGRRYLAPLIKGEDYPPYKDGLPQYVVLKNKPVRKKLKTAFVI